VQQSARRQRLLEQVPREPRRELRRGVEGEARLDLLRDGDGGDPDERPLEGGGDGAGVGHVVAEVQAEVDAREEQLRPLVAEQVQAAPVHAVRRGAVYGPALRPDELGAERVVQRQRVAGGAALLVRRDGEDVADLREGRGEALDALGEDPVVVGDEDARPRHAAGTAGSGAGITNMRTMYARIPG